MVERLRGLSFASRAALFVVSAVLLFLLALGMGAGAAFVVDGHFEMAPIGSFGTATPEGGKPATPGATRETKNAASESPTNSIGTGDNIYDVSFVHHASDNNSRGDYTYISDASIDGDANAVVLVSTAPDRGSGAAASTYDHNVGVWYEPVAREWAIFNQDRAGVTPGAAFEVKIPRASVAFVHDADLLNTAGNYTYIDNTLTNGDPEAVLAVTQNWNPGGGRGVYNDHAVGTRYDAKVQKWTIFNRDGAPMPQGSAFNIVVSTPHRGSG